MINIDLEGCQNVWFGTKEVDALYLADKLIWQRQKEEYVPNPETDFWFTTTANTTIERGGSSTYNKNVQYSFDGYNWTQWNHNVDLTINVGDILLVKGTGNAMGSNGMYNYYFKSSDTTPCLSIHGNLAALTNNTEASYKYRAAFKDLKNLVDASELIMPALSTACFQYMFQNCINLIYPPQLPATELVEYCYGFMFKGCTSLTTAPDLPATELKQACYPNMFEGCTNLNYIKAMFTTTPSTTYTGSWVSGVAATGTFVKNADATWDVTGVNGVPTGWTVETAIDTSKALKFTAVDKNVNLSFTNIGTIYFEYTNGIDTWTQWDGSALTIAPDESVYIRGNNTTISTTYSGYGQFKTSYSSGKLKCEGNIMHLLGEDVTEITTNYCFYGIFSSTSLVNAPELPATTLTSNCYSRMFNNCTSLVNAPSILPATTLASSCYSDMFNGCTILQNAPELPATTLASSCYSNMFAGCTVLVTAPELPATTLASSCYGYMFNRCTSLVNAPELPATTLENQCYNNMFNGCTSLVNAPELPATTLKLYCYSGMFNGCSSLNYIKMLAIDISASNCLNNWVSGVAATGTFIKNVDATWDITGVNGVPEGWALEYYPVNIIKCKSLSITADDVIGNITTTTIYWTAICECENLNTGEIIEKTFTNTAISEPFPQNTSTTETVERTISYTYMGVTATTTITQGVWVVTNYTIDLNDNWQLSTTISNPDTTLYDGVYESFSNTNVTGTAATMYIDIFGYETFKLYISSNYAYNYGGVIVSQLDKNITYDTNSSDSTLVKDQCYNYTIGTTIDNYKLVEFTGIDSGAHRITILFKNWLLNTQDSKGYVLIPNDQ